MSRNILWQIVLFAGMAYALMRLLRRPSGGGAGCCGGHGHEGGHARTHAAGDGERGQERSSAIPESEGAYYCPMHPEIASDDPEATCPKCGGMKLQPRTGRSTNV